MNLSGKGDRPASQRGGRWHTIYSIISTLVEGLLLALALLWILPLLGIVLWDWVVITILVGFLLFSYVSYLVGHPTVLYKKMGSAEEMIGLTGIVEKDLDPEGLVKVRGELWKAGSLMGSLVKGEVVTVVAINGLKLSVSKKDG